jgi:hypothetical protein
MSPPPACIKNAHNNNAAGLAGSITQRRQTMSGVFIKTQKGQEAMNQRQGLSPKVRRVLICVDGRRSLDELCGLASAEDVLEAVALLEQEGYIELSGATAAVEDDDATQAGRLQGARDFMADSFRAFKETIYIAPL